MSGQKNRPVAVGIFGPVANLTMENNSFDGVMPLVVDGPHGRVDELKFVGNRVVDRAIQLAGLSEAQRRDLEELVNQVLEELKARDRSEIEKEVRDGKIGAFLRNTIGDAANVTTVIMGISAAVRQVLG